MLVWPRGLLPPASERWTLQSNVIRGGVSVSGIAPVARFDGGGLWLCEMGEIDIWTKPMLNTARALDYAMDSGVTPVIVEAFELPFAPAVEASAFTGVPHSDGALFSDGSLYVGGGMSVTLATAADLRATTITIALADPTLIVGGERFSIDHLTKGRRLYGIAGVVWGEGEATLTIRPPLREATPAATVLDFDRPSCVMRLLNPENWLGPLDSLHEMVGNPTFVEAF